MKQMSSDTLHTLRVQGEAAPEPVKYVLLVLMVSPHPAEKVQQVPNPLAQLPDAVPPLLEHSLLVKHVPWLPEVVVHSELGNWMT